MNNRSRAFQIFGHVSRTLDGELLITIVADSPADVEVGLGLRMEQTPKPGQYVWPRPTDRLIKAICDGLNRVPVDGKDRHPPLTTNDVRNSLRKYGSFSMKEVPMAAVQL